MISKNERFLSLVLAVAIIINILLFYSLNKLEKQCFIYKNEIQNNAMGLSEKTQYEFYMLNNILNNNIQIDKETLITDSIGKSYFIENLFKGKDDYILVCRISDKYCNDCITSAIEELKKNFKFNMNNFCILGFYEDNKELSRFKRLHKIENLEMYNSRELDIPAEKIAYPYYFIMNSELRILDIFFPDGSRPKVTQRYLNLIQNKYFNIKGS